MPKPRFLPPIMQVLEIGCSQQGWCEEGKSTVVIWADSVQLQRSTANQCQNRPRTPLSHLMKTIDLRAVGATQEDTEHFSYIVCFPEEDPAVNQDDSDTRTIFKERRPSTSRGYLQSRGLSFGQNTMSGLMMAARKILPEKMSDTIFLKRVPH